MIQLLDSQEYPVAKVDIIKKGFNREAAVEIFVAYLNGLYQLPGFPRYKSDRITSFTCLQILTIKNNSILGAVQFMVEFQGMHFYTKNDLYIHFHKHASIFCKAMLSTIDGGGQF